MGTEIKDKNLKEYAWRVCKDYLGGQWKSISWEELRLFDVRGGLSNALYRCSLPENSLKCRHEPKDVLLRIFGPIQCNMDVILTEAVSFMFLSERHLGPKLHGLFSKGRLEEFIPSHSLSSDDLRSFSLTIAREMAKIHSLEVPIKKVPDLFPDTITKWLEEVEEIIINDKENSFMSCEEYRKEIDWITKEMEISQSPILYCHNDLQGGNILYREDSSENGRPDLMLIDFEFGRYNYREFDFGNHFIEWCFDYDTDEYPHFKVDLNKFPTEQEQREFFTAYLDQMSKEGFPLKRPLNEELNQMIFEVPLFVSAAHLIWSLWSIKMLLSCTMGFAHKIYRRNYSEEINNRENGTTTNYHQIIETIEIGIVAAIQEHGKLRRKLYHMYKKQYLASISSRKNNKDV